jgi:hypothetical protein
MPKMLIKKWAFKYDKCVACGSTEKEHGGKGHCVSCYGRILQKETRINYRLLHPSQRTQTVDGFKYSDATRPKPKNCEICNKECNANLDHDHKTNKFRGWLCLQCNTSLGAVKDKIEILHKMIEYLVKNS